jgi:hypothetical protein
VSQRGFKIATDALRTEGDTWKQQGGQLFELGGTIHQLQFFGSEGGIYARLVPTYNGLVTKLVMRCSEADASMTHICDTLYRIAQMFEEDEARNVERIKRAAAGSP